MGKELLYSRDLSSEVGFPQSAPSVIYMDSQAAIDFSHNPVHFSRMKSIQLKFLAFKQSVSEKQLLPVKCTGQNQFADFLTKATSITVHRACTAATLKIGVHNVPISLVSVRQLESSCSSF
jgi:hypothetical protein